jgi:hypothetical protein
VVIIIILIEQHSKLVLRGRVENLNNEANNNHWGRAGTSGWLQPQGSLKMV